MADASFVQTSFLGGEWSQAMQGRIDHPAYRSAMNVCLNSFPMEQGAWMRRPGSRLIAPTFLGRTAKLVSFQFKQSNPYTMEVTHAFIRFYAGPRLAITNDAQAVVSISTASPAKVMTAGAHGWTSIDQVQFANLGQGCPTLQGRRFTIVVTSPTEFTLFNELTTAGIDGASLGDLPVGATVQRILRIGNPYADADLPNLRVVQTEQIAVFLNANFMPQIAKAETLPTSTTDATFSLSPAVLNDGPYLDPVAGSVMTPNAVSGTVTLTQTGNLVNDGVGFTAADVGRLIRLFSEPKPWPGPGTGLAGDVVKSGGGYWIQQVDATATPPGSVGVFAAPNQGQQSPFSQIAATSVLDITATPQWLPLTVAAAAAWCSCKIASVIGPQQITVNTLSRNLVAVTPITTWRLGAYGGPNGYPTCGTYHEGRLWLAGAIANRVDGSNSNALFNFSPTLDDGTVVDSNAISATFNSSEANPIFWMEPDQQGILIGTQGGEWLLQAPTTGAMSPTNIAARRVTKIKCANIEPRRTEHTLVFVQTFGRKIMEYFADVYSGKFSAPNLTEKAKHLTKTNIAELAYQQELAPIIWARRGDGTLIGATYKRDSLTSSQGPTFCGWHKHTLGHGRTIESMCVSGSSGGNLDSLFMSTVDATTGNRYVEMLTDIQDEDAPIADYWNVDGGMEPASYERLVINGVDSAVLHGFWHLNGKTVSVFAGGLDCGDFPVSNGSIIVPFGDGVSAGTGSGMFTPAVLLSGDPIIAGSTYTSRGQIVRPSAPAETGARNGPAFAKKRRTQQYGLQVVNTSGLSIGTDFAKMYPVPFKNDAGASLAVGQTFSGIYNDTVLDDYSYDSMLCWQVSRPLPAMIAAIGGFLHTMDK